MNVKHFTLVCLLALAVPETSLAHSPVEGLGSFYNGLLHPVLVPAHLLLLVAVGLFTGQQGPNRLQPALVVYAFSTFAGLTAAWFSTGTEFEIFILVLSAVTGLLIAINLQLRLLWCGVVALSAGFLLGIDSAQEALSGKDKLVTLFGSGFAICLLALYPMVLADHFNKRAWQKIGVRVVGSWVAASSLLVLALSFSGGA